MKFGLVKRKYVDKPLIFEPQDKLEGEIFNLVDDSILENIEPARYLVSNMGRIWDCKLEVWKNPIPNSTKRNKPYYKTKFNYYIDNDGPEFKQRDMYFHRIVKQSFDPINNYENLGLEVDHLDSDHTNNKLDNLEWAKPEENKKRAQERGELLHGDNHPFSKISEKQAHEICKLLENGYNVLEISKIFNINRSCVQSIKKGDNFKYISSQYNIPEIKKIKDKLSEDRVHEICKRLEKGDKVVDIARDMNVGRTTICAIKSGRNFSHISSQYNIPEIKKCKVPTELEVHMICKRLENEESMVDISKSTGISLNSIRNIKSKKIYTYISSQYRIPEPGSQYISDDMIKSICALIEKGYSNNGIYKLIGEKLGISLAIISNIRNHKSGNHISKDFNF